MISLTQADTALRQALSAGESPKLLIIGGGITGAAIFAKAAAAGLKPWLIEQGDFSSGTSSRSSKMLHGGLRYLAQGDVGTVIESARQKQWFAKALPDHVDSLPFLYLHRRGSFPPGWLLDWVLRFYDWLSNNKAHRRISPSGLQQLSPGLNLSQYQDGNLYYDSVTDDSALVLSLLQTGVKYGGLCANYLAADQLIEDDGKVVGAEITELSNERGTSRCTLSSQCIINATGAWADKLHPLAKGHMRPLRGSHLVFPFWKLPVAASITFPHPEDSRPVYIYPWSGVTVVGCTDLVHQEPLDKSPYMSPDEKRYLMAAVEHVTENQRVLEQDIISSWSGVRPVLSKGNSQNSPSKEPRRHQIWQKPGLVSIASGKLVTAMVMADDAMAAACSQLKLDWNAAQQMDTVSFKSPDNIDGLADILANGAVKSLADLLLHRSRFALVFGRKLQDYHLQLQHMCCQQLGWSEVQFNQQWQSFWQHWSAYYSPCPTGVSSAMTVGNGL